MKRSPFFCATILLAIACQGGQRPTAPDLEAGAWLDDGTAGSPAAPNATTNRVHRSGRSPVIDGRMSHGEWAGATRFAFAVNLPEGGTTPARLYVKHDGTNLFLMLRYERTTPDAVDVVFEFDNDDDGTRENGDDALVYSKAAGRFFDDVRTNQSPPCPEGSPPAFCAPSDDAVGGTIDGSGAFGIDGEFSVYELVHPLNSGDTGHDLAIQNDSQVGMWFQVQMGSGTSFASTTFPTFGFTHLTFCCGVR